MGDHESAWAAHDTANSMLTSPLNKFLSFSAASMQAKEGDTDAAQASLQQAREVVDQFQLKFLETQVQMVEGLISEANGDYESMAMHYLKSIEELERTVIANDLQISVPRIYAEVARAQIKTNKLDLAERSIETGFRIDPSEPTLWVSKARLLQARGMTPLALASVNFALAIWKDADEDYVLAKKARALAAELQNADQ